MRVDGFGKVLMINPCFILYAIISLLNAVETFESN
jgi:hypothetical protein